MMSRNNTDLKIKSVNINAWAASEVGGNVSKMQYQTELGPDDILIDILHCGISKGDIHFIDNFWNDTKYPVIVGHQMIGKVVAKGAAVENHQIYDIVGVGYQLNSCMQCDNCKSGKQQFCAKQEVMAYHKPGGLAEQMVVNKEFAYQLPKTRDAIEYLPFMCSGLTVYSGIKKAGLRPNAKVAVLGIGSLGHLAIQFLHAMGHQVSAISHSQNKKAAIEAMGAEFADISDKDSLQKLIGKFDFIISTTDHAYDLEEMLKLLTAQGKLCLIGLPKENFTFNAGVLADFASKTIYGSYIGSHQEMHEMLSLVEEKKLRAQYDKFDFTQINQAIELVRTGTSRYSAILSRN